MSSVWILVCNNLWHITWWYYVILHYSVSYWECIAKSCHEDHVSTVNIIVCAFLEIFGNTDYVLYLDEASLWSKNCTSVMHHVGTWSVMCNVVMYCFKPIIEGNLFGGWAHALGEPQGLVGIVWKLHVCGCSSESSNYSSFGQFGLVYLIMLDTFGLICHEGGLPFHVSVPLWERKLEVGTICS